MTANILLLLVSLMFTTEVAVAQTGTTVRPEENTNWTSCEEFMNNTVFDAEKVLHIDFKIFFFWNPDIEETYNIRFSRPSKILIDRFRVELGKELKPPANWSNAELFMETAADFSALFLKTNKSGFYRIIPATAFDYNIQVPLLIFAMKLVEPGYLGIANCRHRICYALAPVDKMPYHYELEKAAKLLGFYNPYNRTHIPIAARAPSQIPYALNEPDDEQDEDLEVDQDLNRMDLL